MPTILMILGWRLFFYSNEGNEPVHIHCLKGEIECKFWLDTETIDIIEDYSYNMSPKDRREIRIIIFQYFKFIEEQWNLYHGGR